MMFRKKEKQRKPRERTARHKDPTKIRKVKLKCNTCRHNWITEGPERSCPKCLSPDNVVVRYERNYTVGG